MNKTVIPKGNRSLVQMFAPEGRLEPAFPQATLKEVALDFIRAVYYMLIGMATPIALLFIYSVLTAGSIEGFTLVSQALNDPQQQAYLTYIGVALAYLLVLLDIRDNSSRDGHDWKTRLALNTKSLGGSLPVWVLVTYATISLSAWSLGEVFGPTTLELPPTGSGSFPGYILLPTVFMLVSPVLEEILFRGIIFQKLRAALNRRIPGIPADAAAVLLSSAVFALFYDDFIIWFTVGIILAESYRRSGSLLVPVLAHVLFVSSLALKSLLLAG